MCCEKEILKRFVMVCAVRGYGGWVRFNISHSMYWFGSLSWLCEKQFFMMIVLRSSGFEFRLSSSVSLWLDNHSWFRNPPKFVLKVQFVVVDPNRMILRRILLGDMNIDSGRSYLKLLVTLFIFLSSSLCSRTNKIFSGGYYNDPIGYFWKIWTIRLTWVN